MLGQEKNRYSLLVVEDNDVDAELVIRLLSRRLSNLADGSEFDVRRASHFEEAFNILSSERVDVVLLDLDLPDCSGDESLQRITDYSPLIPVIVLTGMEDEELAVRAVRQGAQDYLTKDDLSEKELLRCLLYAIERNARLVAQQELRVARYEQAIAGRIQNRLLPRSAPPVEHFDIAGACSTPDEVGGDYFDYIPMKDGQLGIVVADVTGHGLGPALIMAGTRRLLRTCAETHTSVGGILTLANQAVFEDIEEGRFVTMFFACLDFSLQSLVYSSAGHPGYIIQPSGVIQMLPALDFPLGVSEETRYGQSDPIHLRRGSTLVLLTDGFFEAHDPVGNQWGIDTVLSHIRSNSDLSADEIVASLFDALRNYCEPNRPRDDAAVIIAKAH